MRWPWRREASDIGPACTVNPRRAELETAKEILAVATFVPSRLKTTELTESLCLIRAMGLGRIPRHLLRARSPSISCFVRGVYILIHLFRMSAVRLIAS